MKCKVNVEIDLEEFFHRFDDYSLASEIECELKEKIKAEVCRSVEYLEKLNSVKAALAKI